MSEVKAGVIDEVPKESIVIVFFFFSSLSKERKRRDESIENSRDLMSCSPMFDSWLVLFKLSG